MFVKYAGSEISCGGKHFRAQNILLSCLEVQESEKYFSPRQIHEKIVELAIVAPVYCSICSEAQRVSIYTKICLAFSVSNAAILKKN